MATTLPKSISSTTRPRSNSSASAELGRSGEFIPVVYKTGQARATAGRLATSCPIRRLSRCASCAKPWPEIREWSHEKNRWRRGCHRVAGRAGSGPRMLFRNTGTLTRTRRIRKSRPRKRRRGPTSGRWAIFRNKRATIPGGSRSDSAASQRSQGLAGQAEGQQG